MFYCNACYVHIKVGEVGTATSCGHLYCRSCFGKILAKKSCIVCGTACDGMSWKDVQICAGIQQPQDQLSLVGYQVEQVVSLALASIQFRMRQDELYAKLKHDRLSQRCASMEQQCRKKMDEIQQAYVKMKEECEGLRRERDDLHADNAELRDKFSQKALEARNLRNSMHRTPSTSPGYHHTAMHGHMASRSPAQAATHNNTSGPMMMVGHHQGPAMSNRSLQQSFQSLNPARAHQAQQQGPYCESPRLLSSAQGTMGGAMIVRPAYSTPNNGMMMGMNSMSPLSTPRRQIHDRGAYQSDPVRNQSQPGFVQAPMGLIP